FMVAKKVRVLSRSYKPGSEGYEWISDGTGSYEIGPAEGLERGTKIILELKENAYEFTEPENIKRLIRQYSSFVPFPISVNNEAVNTVQAIWKRNKNEVSDEEYTEFYKYIANAYDAPFYRLHFSTDVPLSINALLFVPKQNFEQFGFGRVKPGVNLYCKKILIQQHSENILPEWLRFIKGVVDSEDIPLNISRETMQDSTLIKKLNKVITRRFLKFLTEKAGTDPESYNEFWNIFGNYLKEGMASDFTYKEQLAKLLRFESSKSDPGKLISLNDYIGRMKEEQKDIYFINGPTRQAIETGPYIEAFRALEYEVVYTHEPIDDFILSNLTEFEGKKLISADQAQLELPPIDNTLEIKPLDDETMNSLINWFKETLGDKVSEIKRSERLTESPAIMLNLDGMLTSSMQRAMQSVNKDLVNSGKKILEINPRHKLIQCLASLQKERPDLAKLIAEQIYDNALISSGLFVEPRIMVKRIYQLLEHVTSEN
ncbi:MAG: Chaperone protein HtpG, partial [Pelotomaculum thermopropionicum]